MTDPSFLDHPPLTERVNAYDEAHLGLYLRLLVADEEGAEDGRCCRYMFLPHVA
ncbi:hypothetical protein [Komagataeibacter oboediens]|uniref:hypothetical protein n=1 Tax=Komagataeibacter oboediens TaxID=65958 RepID=UPI001FD2F16A|nr:hypothetical protein [Komagataeibacter oboediens]